LEEIIKASAETPPKKYEYLHWDELRHKVPPMGLSHEEWWLATKLRGEQECGQFLSKTNKDDHLNLAFLIPWPNSFHHIAQGSGGNHRFNRTGDKPTNEGPLSDTLTF